MLILLKQNIPFVLCISYPFFSNKRNILWQGFRNTISPQEQLRYWQGRREKKNTVWLKSYHEGSLCSQHHPVNSCKMLLLFWNYFKNPMQDREEAQWTGITLLGHRTAQSISCLTMRRHYTCTINSPKQLHSRLLLLKHRCDTAVMWNQAVLSSSDFFRTLHPEICDQDRQLFLFSFANEWCVTRHKKGSHRTVINIQRTKLALDLVFWAKIGAYFRKILKEGSCSCH